MQTQDRKLVFRSAATAKLNSATVRFWSSKYNLPSFPVSKPSPYKTIPTQRQNAASPCLKRLIFDFGTAIILTLPFETLRAS